MDKEIQDKYLKKFDILHDNHYGDNEVHHLEADELLQELLIEIGYKKIVDQFRIIEKWYA